MPDQIPGPLRSIPVGLGGKTKFTGMFSYFVTIFIYIFLHPSVNLGGLFVLEPFISPAIFQKYPDAVDEWTLSTLMAADTANGGLNQIEDHYNTFITEQDIAEIAGAGLNWIRLPIPFWAIETWAGEPFLAKVSWK
jgi:aryl-phospho-beta-D-glucosidase BglC (GH1 family)